MRRILNILCLGHLRSVLGCLLGTVLSLVLSFFIGVMAGVAAGASLGLSTTQRIWPSSPLGEIGYFIGPLFVFCGLMAFAVFIGANLGNWIDFFLLEPNTADSTTPSTSQLQVALHRLCFGHVYNWTGCYIGALLAIFPGVLLSYSSGIYGSYIATRGMERVSTEIGFMIFFVGCIAYPVIFEFLLLMVGVNLGNWSGYAVTRLFRSKK